VSTLERGHEDPGSKACLECHKGTSSPGKGHDLACATCHGLQGQPLAERCLATVANPSAPGTWAAACGPCHADALARMERSLHYTQAGVINHTRYLLGAQDRVAPPVTTLPQMAAREGLDPATFPAGDPAALADDLLRRRCLRCHLLQPGVGDADLQRGAGCAACHVPRTAEDGAVIHTLVRPTQTETCLRCHHGDHTGADYVGLFPADDHADYRVPLADGADRPDRFGRDHHRLVPDLHNEAGLVCVDCHGQDEVMGRPDGPAPAFAAEAVQVRCASCHGDLAGDHPTPAPDGLTRDPGGAWLALKTGGATLAVPAAAAASLGHDPRAHSRLACVACHAAWAGQAFGAHLHRSLVGATWNLWDRRAHQGDPEFQHRVAQALALSEDARFDHAPAMTDRLTFRRWEEPALGVTPDGRIAPLRPRSGFVLTSVGADGLVWLDSLVPTRGDGSGPGRASETFSPHTVRREAAACTRCHGNPRAAGLGIAATAADGALHPDTVPAPPAIPGSRLLTDAERERLLHPNAAQRAAISRALQRLGLLHISSG